MSPGSTFGPQIKILSGGVGWRFIWGGEGIGGNIGTIGFGTMSPGRILAGSSQLLMCVKGRVEIYEVIQHIGIYL